LRKVSKSAENNIFHLSLVISHFLTFSAQSRCETEQ
jgi:hypothetical protein